MLPLMNLTFPKQKELLLLVITWEVLKWMTTTTQTLEIWNRLTDQPKLLLINQIWLEVLMHLKGILIFTSLNLNTLNNPVKLLHKTEVLINHQPTKKVWLGLRPSRELAAPHTISLKHLRLDTLLALNKKAMEITNWEILAQEKVITKKELTIHSNNIMSQMIDTLQATSVLLVAKFKAHLSKI